MELDGFSHAIVATFKDDGSEEVNTNVQSGGLSDDGVFRIDAKTSLGVLNASISGLAPQTTNISGSNEIVAVSGQGTGAVTCTLGVNDLPADVKYKLIGAQQNSDTGAWELDKDTKSPYAAIELTSQGRKGSQSDAVHIALLKGQFFAQSENLRTNSGTGSINRTTDSLQFKAINRHKDGEVVQIGFQRQSGFNLDRFHADVFPGASFANVSDDINVVTSSNNAAPVTPANN